MLSYPCIWVPSTLASCFPSAKRWFFFLPFRSRSLSNSGDKLSIDICGRLYLCLSLSVFFPCHAFLRERIDYSFPLGWTQEKPCDLLWPIKRGQKRCVWLSYSSFKSQLVWSVSSPSARREQCPERDCSTSLGPGRETWRSSAAVPWWTRSVRENKTELLKATEILGIFTAAQLSQLWPTRYPLSCGSLR